MKRVQSVDLHRQEEQYSDLEISKSPDIIRTYPIITVAITILRATPDNYQGTPSNMRIIDILRV
jgi:hypothetical protein